MTEFHEKEKIIKKNFMCVVCLAKSAEIKRCFNKSKIITYYYICRECMTHGYSNLDIIPKNSEEFEEKIKFITENMPINSLTELIEPSKEVGDYINKKQIKWKVKNRYICPVCHIKGTTFGKAKNKSFYLFCKYCRVRLFLEREKIHLTIPALYMIEAIVKGLEINEGKHIRKNHTELIGLLLESINNR